MLVRRGDSVRGQRHRLPALSLRRQAPIGGDKTRPWHPRGLRHVSTLHPICLNKARKLLARGQIRRLPVASSKGPLKAICDPEVRHGYYGVLLVVPLVLRVGISGDEQR